MRFLGRLPVILMGFALVACWIGGSAASAGEVLINGNLDTGVAPPGWSIATSITGIPGSEIPQVFEHLDGANNPFPGAGGLGLLLHPQKGNQGIYEGQDKMINFVLEQTFPAAVAGRTYTFKGDTMLQDGYSGINDMLSAYHPVGDYNNDFKVDGADYTTWRDAQTAGLNTLPNRDPAKTNDVDPVDEADFTSWRNNYGFQGHDAVASPTMTTFEMAFLDVNDAVLGTPMVFDLRDDPTTLEWRTHTLVDTAPTNTKKVRVRASALDMIDNRGSMLGQDVFFDNFSLTDSIATTLNRLTNGNLNTPGEPVGWTLAEGPTVDLGGGMFDTADTASFIDFANRKIATSTPNPTPPPEFTSQATGPQGLWLRPFVNVTQFEPDLPAVPGVDAVLTQVVPGTEFAEYTFSAWTAWEQYYSGGFPGTTTDTFIKMEFLDGSMAVLGTEELNLQDAGQTNSEDASTTYEDWHQWSVNGMAPAGTENVRVSLGATGMYSTELNPQSAFFDEMSLIETLPGAGSGSVAVPEPSSLLLLLLGMALGISGIGRRRG